MIKLFLVFIQLIIIIFVASLIINYSYPVSVTFDEIILSTSTSFLLFFLILIVFSVIFIQRILYFFKYSFFAIRVDLMAFFPS